MGRVVDETPVPQSSNEIPSQPQTPQGYPNQHNNPLSSPPPPPQPQEAYMGNGNQHTNQPQTPRSYVPPQSPQNVPPPEAYPPQKQETYPTQQIPETYPPQQPQAAYPPQPVPAAYPPQQQPSTYPPQQPSSYPPQQQPTTYPPQQTPQSYPPQQPTVGNGSPYNPQSYNYNAQPQVNYGATPMNMGTPNGVPIGVQYAPTQGWRTGLLDCFEDPESAIMTFCFPCVTFGQIAEILDNGNTSCATSGLIYTLITAFIGIPCIMSCSYRTKLRSRYGLVESPAPDWVIHFFCEYCALCQEYRELKFRGMDPAIGWQGNLSKNQQMANYATMTPPMNQTMRN